MDGWWLWWTYVYVRKTVQVTNPKFFINLILILLHICACILYLRLQFSKIQHCVVWSTGRVWCDVCVMTHAQKLVFIFHLNGQVCVFWQGWPFCWLLPAKVCTSACSMSTGETFTLIHVEVKDYSLHSPVFLSVFFHCISVCHYIAIVLYLHF